MRLKGVERKQAALRQRVLRLTAFAMVSLAVILSAAVAASGWRPGPIFFVGVNPNAPPLAVCSEDEIRDAMAALPPYEPTSMGEFVRIENNRFFSGGEPLTVRGVNYFPVRYPWRRFLADSDLESIDREFALLRAAGLNSIRTFLWHEALFQCPGSGAVPRPDVFARLDGIIHAAARHDLRVILTLNDLPDLTDYPLYTNPAHTQAQTEFIVRRYRDEPALLAWDVRNEGDIDYSMDRGRFPKAQVLGWLDAAAAQVRGLDERHLLTAGWMSDAEATAPHVDFVSFHHWWDAADLRSRIAQMRAAADKPLLLQEFGYSTFRVREEEQARLIGDGARTAEAENLLGWMVWTAFDFPVESTCLPPNCPDVENAEHHFGLWRADYTSKPAALVLSNP